MRADTAEETVEAIERCVIALSSWSGSGESTRLWTIRVNQFGRFVVSLTHFDDHTTDRLIECDGDALLVALKKAVEAIARNPDLEVCT